MVGPRDSENVDEPFIAVVVTGELVVEDITLTKVTSGLRRVGNVTIILIGPGGDLRGILNTTKNFNGGVSVISVRGFNGFRRDVFFKGAVTKFVLYRAGVDVTFLVSRLRS